MSRAVLLALSVCLTMPCMAAEFIDPSVAKPDQGRGAVALERDKHFGTNRLPALIFVDGHAVASVKGGEAIIIYVPIGSHVMGATLVKNATSPDQSIAVEVSEGSATRIKAHLGNWGWSGMQLQRDR